MSVRRIRTSLLFAVALLVPAAALAAGGSTSPSLEEAAPKSPEQQAVDLYNQGLGARDRAWKLEEKLAATDDEARRAKIEQKIARAWEDAIRDFTGAIDRNPRMFQAHSSLGYAYRKTRRFEDSLRAYDRALALEPDYAEAIEYRGEAYLGLDRIDEAKQAYIRLFGMDRNLADELLTAMKRWVDERRADPAGTEPERLDALAAWIAEREQIARQTASLSPRPAGGDAW